jgi:predicted nucleotidyltransferase
MFSQASPRSRRILEDCSPALKQKECGDAKPYSDLDLVISDDESVAELALAEAAGDFYESALLHHVDLAHWRDLPVSLRRAVAQDNVRLSR